MLYLAPFALILLESCVPHSWHLTKCLTTFFHILTTLWRLSFQVASQNAKTSFSLPAEPRRLSYVPCESIRFFGSCFPGRRNQSGKNRILSQAKLESKFKVPWGWGGGGVGRMRLVPTNELQVLRSSQSSPWLVWPWIYGFSRNKKER